MTKQQTLSLSKIKSNPENPRIIKDDKFKKLVQSLKDFPVMTELREVLLDENDVIIGGNMRYKAAKEAGWTEISVKYFTREDAERNNKLTKQNKTYEEYVKELVIKDNLSGGEWDWDIIANQYDPIVVDGWGLDLPDKSILEPEIEEDEAPEVSKDPPQSVLGAVYQLGRHRVMCGDSTDKASVELLMNGVKADMVFTDPPYRIKTEGGKKGLLGKSLSSQGQSIEFISDFEPDNLFNVLPDVFKKSYFNAYIFCNKDLLPEYLTLITANKLAFNVLIWLKPNAIPIGSDYRPDIEYLLFIRKNATWNTGIKDANYSRVFNSERETGLHPTMKPIKIIASCIKVSSNKDDAVLDLFLGSGSTLIACEQTDRTCYGMELDPKYVDVIRKRYAKYCYPDTWEERWEELTPEISVGAA